MQKKRQLADKICNRFGTRLVSKKVMFIKICLTKMFKTSFQNEK